MRWEVNAVRNLGIKINLRRVGTLTQVFLIGYAETLPEDEKARQDYLKALAEKRPKQQNLKQRQREHGCRTTEYQQPIDLKALVLELLWAKIDKKFTDDAANRQSVYIKRQVYFERLIQYVLRGEPSLAKSALLANRAPAYQQAHPDELVFLHFCGSSPGSTEIIVLFLSTLSAQRLSLPLLIDKSARQVLIRKGLKSYSKTEMQRLLDAPQTFKLGNRFDAYLQAQKVLARLEEDYQPPEAPHLVENVLSLLWAARWGLRESELLAILEIPQAIWSPLYLALENALVSRAGLLSFFHDYLRQAVERRYLPSRSEQQRRHLRLADYFEKQPLDGRVADELPWQFYKAGEGERLRVCIRIIWRYCIKRKEILSPQNCFTNVP